MTQAKQIIHLLIIINNFYPVILYRRVEEESDELYGLVTRYGPQSVASVGG